MVRHQTGSVTDRPRTMTDTTATTMDTFFQSIDDSCKLRLDGAILHDTAIIPDFAAKYLGVDVKELWASLLACDTQDAGKAIDFNPSYPRWIPGNHTDLHYRGNDIARHKMWFQQDPTSYRKYSYTGWNHSIAKATYNTKVVPLLDQLCNKSLFEKKHNQWIVTKYEDENDCIGLHSDKTHTWEEGSCFSVIKLGDTRPFQFSNKVPVIDDDSGEQVVKSGKPEFRDEVFWQQDLKAGTAVIVGMQTNELVKHGVPKSDAPVGKSGSIVGRSIKSTLTWDAVMKKSDKLYAVREKRKLKQMEETMGKMQKR
jgi:hypothetical protein